MKTIKLDLTFSKFVIKPVICSYYIYLTLSGIIAAKLATIVSIAISVVIYGLAVIALKIFTKEEIAILPAGDKISKILTKLKIY